MGLLLFCQVTGSCWLASWISFLSALSQFTAADKEALQAHIDQQLIRIEAEERDLTLVILHVDLDGNSEIIQSPSNSFLKTIIYNSFLCCY
jgi:hypothetical protein